MASAETGRLGERRERVSLRKCSKNASGHHVCCRSECLLCCTGFHPVDRASSSIGRRPSQGRSERHPIIQIDTVLVALGVGDAHLLTQRSEPQTGPCARVPVTRRVSIQPDAARVGETDDAQLTAHKQRETNEGNAQLNTAKRGRIAGKTVPTKAAQTPSAANERRFVRAENCPSCADHPHATRELASQ